ncbi:MAG: ATP-binding protein [Saprospiraceae bacterium]|nr:ATP-binding protein [Saprospiraceae bacterium]MBK7810502.1 ATP-binding protein [Saprospiraceae bacterium]MBK9630093.1 ATP-binding protein [Saprospiraceae bacterium]
MIRISSVPHNIVKIEQYLNQVFADYQISPAHYHNVLIALTEAVNNAITHGNRQDENKFVQINSQHSRRCITFRISDEGSGFDPASIPDPTLPENLERCGGRGVFLMQKLCKKVIFSDNGRTVQIEFEV